MKTHVLIFISLLFVSVLFFAPIRFSTRTQTTPATTRATPSPTQQSRSQEATTEAATTTSTLTTSSMTTTTPTSEPTLAEQRELEEGPKRENSEQQQQEPTATPPFKKVISVPLARVFGHDGEKIKLAKRCRLGLFRVVARRGEENNKNNISSSSSSSTIDYRNDDHVPLIKAASGKRHRERKFRFEKQQRQPVAPVLTAEPLTSSDGGGDKNLTAMWFRGDHLLPLLRKGGTSSSSKKTAKKSPNATRRRGGGIATALLLSGELRRTALSARQQHALWVQPNRADVFCATWPDPIDEPAVTSRALDFQRSKLEAHFGRFLAGVRVDAYNPRRFFGTFLAKPGHTAEMFFLHEAVARLALEYERRVVGGGFEYDFFLRSRPDLKPFDTLKFFALSLPSGGGGGGGGGGADQPRDSWGIQVGERREKRKLTAPPGVGLFVNDHQLLCLVSDWIAAGRRDAILRASFLFEKTVALFVSAAQRRHGDSSSGEGAAEENYFIFSSLPRGQLVVDDADEHADITTTYPTQAECEQELLPVIDAFNTNKSKKSGAAVSSPSSSSLSSITTPRQQFHHVAEKGGGCYAESCLAAYLMAEGIDWASADLRATLSGDLTIRGNKRVLPCKDLPLLMNRKPKWKF